MLAFIPSHFGPPFNASWQCTSSGPDVPRDACEGPVLSDAGQLTGNRPLILQ